MTDNNKIARTKRPEYLVWSSMIQRCHNSGHQAYKWYGHRGIEVCKEWRSSFDTFLSDMGPRPENGSLDRINNNDGYHPGNCRWATQKEQCRNRRNNVLITVHGTCVCVSEASEIYGIPEMTIRMRIRSGVTGDELVAPLKRICPKKLLSHNGQTLSVSEWAKITGISHNAILRRLKRGWTLAQALSHKMTGGGERDTVSGRFNRVRATA